MNKLIGKGSFTKAYYNKDLNLVILKSCCPIKECMALGYFPDSELFPKLKRVAFETYEMEYYPKVSSLKNNLNPDQWVIYKQLRALMNQIGFVSNPYASYSATYKLFEELENKELACVMCEALNGCSNWGTDIAFEITPRNVAAKNGKLILLDVFFSQLKLKEVQNDSRGLK